MRYLILFLPFLIGANWIHPTDIGKIQSGQDGVTIYTTEKSCSKNNSSQRCFQIDDCDPRYCTVQPIQIDDPEKPIWGPKTNKQDCANPQVCSALIESCDDDGLECVQYCDEGLHFKFEQKPGPGGVYEAFCQELIGFQQKTIQVLKANANKKAQVEAQDSADAIEENAKKSRKSQARQFMKDLDPNDDSPGNVRALMQKLKDLFE